MEVRRLEIDDVILITPDRYADERGFFSETYNRDRFAEAAGIVADFVQDNQSLSRAKGTLRGMHFQIPPRAQDKLVRAVRGAVLDVVVDIRVGSPTFGRWVSAVLSAENWAQLWVPKGFAHGVCTLEPDTEIAYKTTDTYSAEHDRGLAWDDPELGIDWPVDETSAVLSERDRGHPRLASLEAYFTHGGDR